MIIVLYIKVASSEGVRAASPEGKQAQRQPSASTTLPKRPLGPALRANPFPEVTDLFCRLPFSTLFYRLEAAHLGDLMRLLVRPGVRISHAARFSRTVGNAPKQSKVNCLYQGTHPFSRQSDSRVCTLVNKKRELSLGLPPASPALLVLPLNIHFLV